MISFFPLFTNTTNTNFSKQKDCNTALRYFQLASDHGNARAQYIMGNMFENGIGVIRKDVVKATKFYTKASQQGHQKATDKLRLLNDTKSPVQG